MLHDIMVKIKLCFFPYSSEITKGLIIFMLRCFQILFSPSQNFITKCYKKKIYTFVGMLSTYLSVIRVNLLVRFFFHRIQYSRFRIANGNFV